MWKAVSPILYLVLTGLIGVIWRQLSARIDYLSKSCEKKVLKDSCDLKEKLMETKVLNLESKVSEIMIQNSKEHAELRKMSEELGRKQDAINAELREISKCLALLSEQLHCS